MTETIINRDATSPPAQDQRVPAAEAQTQATAASGFPPTWNPAITRWVGLLVATAVVAYLCWLVVAPFLDVIVWAVVLVVAFQPMHRRIKARVMSTGWAAAASSLLVIVTILVPLSLAGLAVVHDAARLGALQANKDTLLDSRVLDRPIAWVGRYVSVSREDAQAYITEKARQVGAIILAKSLNVLGGVMGILVQAFMVVFTMFYLFRDGPRLLATLRDLLPLEQWQSHEVFQRTKDVILASVYGSLVIAAVQGTLGGLAFWVLGLPSPLIWGLVMILLSILPVAGSAIVWLPAAVYLAATGHVGKAVMLTAWGAAVIGTIDNFLRPRLVGGRSRLHDLVVFFAVLGGIQVFGVLGVIAGPVVAAIAVALAEVWRQTRRVAATGATPR